MKRFIRLTALLLALLFALTACGSGSDDPTTTAAAGETAAADGPSTSSRDRVKFTMENGGSFVIELYPEYAPDTCDNFKKLVASGFYDGLTFHRIVDGFMAQGGDGSDSAKASEAQPIYGEFASNGSRRIPFRISAALSRWREQTTPTPPPRNSLSAMATRASLTANTPPSAR